MFSCVCVEARDFKKCESITFHQVSEGLDALDSTAAALIDRT